MINNTNAGQRNSQNYVLDIVSPSGSMVSKFFSSLEDLARGVYLQHTSDHESRAFLRAYSARGKKLDVVLLAAKGGNNGRSYWWERPMRRPKDYVRTGTVEGISKWRGGPSYRNHKSMNERRLNGSFIVEEGEIECRATRRDTYLFCSWDGRARSTEKCWKSQHKGLKSWDR